MPLLSSVVIEFNSHIHSNQEVDVIRAVLDQCPRKALTELTIVFDRPAGGRPAMLSGSAGASEDLRQFDAYLTSFPELRYVTFVLPLGGQSRRAFWRSSLQDSFAGLQERGCLNVTETYGACLL